MDDGRISTERAIGILKHKKFAVEYWMTWRRPVMRQTDRDTLYEATIFSKQATDDERWEMDHREAPRIKTRAYAMWKFMIKTRNAQTEKCNNIYNIFERKRI